MPFYWPTGSTVSTEWVTPSLTMVTGLSEYYVLGTIWTTNYNSRYFGLSDITGTAESIQAYRAAQAAQQQAAYERYQFEGCRPSGIGPLWAASAPALITHQEQARRDQELYRRALAEHDDQEAARLLRQIEARELVAADRQRLVEQQMQQEREDRARREAATTRARELLLEHLTPQQRETYVKNGWFVVEGGRTKTKYRIGTRGVAGNIDVLGNGGRVLHRLCCHAQSHIPHGDQWLSQKIMLELAEDDFLRLANRHAA